MPDPSTGGWRQLNLTFDNWQAAERAAAEHLAPLLISADDDSTLSSWWFIRKGPTWRFRLQPGHDADPHQHIEQLLKELTTAAASGGLREWAEPIYEPETHRFGGDTAMTIAHTLFHADSRHLLQHLTTGTDHRPELGLILAARLMTGARQDWYEHGDIWQRVADHRATTAALPDLTPAQLAAVRRLLLATADTDASPLHTTPSWPAAFEQAGAGLADLAARGQLARGLRTVLADHILFLCNRHGIATADQHTLAAASHVVFQHEPATDQPTPARPEMRDDPLGEHRPDAFHQAGTEITLDALDRGGQDGGVGLDLELPPVPRMTRPPPHQPKALTGLSAQQRPDHRQQLITTTAGRHPRHRVAGLLVDIRQPLQHRLQHGPRTTRRNGRGHGKHRACPPHATASPPPGGRPSGSWIVRVSEDGHTRSSPRIPGRGHRRARTR